MLVVVDDELVLRTLRRLLASAGYHTEAHSSLGDLLRSPRCGGPGCLILDLHLPGLSGIELYQLLHEAGCRMPTVFLTGRGSVAASVSAMKLGAVDFLTKPVDDADLLDAVRAALVRDETARRELAEQRELERRASMLTRREAQVWTLVVTGMCNREVAARLGTCEKTIKVHRGRVMEKLRAARSPISCARPPLPSWRPAYAAQEEPCRHTH